MHEPCVGHTMIFTMATDPKISLIFVNYQSFWYLSLALQSLFSVEGHIQLFEVVVVNNDRKESQALRCLSETLHFRLVEVAENKGFGAGANAGAVCARGDILGFINPDILWQKPILNQVVRSFQDWQGILGIRLLNSEGEGEPFSFGHFPTLRRLLGDNLTALPSLSGLPSENQPDWVSGAALFVPRTVFERMTGFDEGFFLYFEDVDFCLRARASGYRASRDESLALVHAGGKSFSSHSSQKQHYYHSQERYYQKHRPHTEFFLIAFLRRCFFFSV